MFHRLLCNIETQEWKQIAFIDKFRMVALFLHLWSRLSNQETSCMFAIDRIMQDMIYNKNIRTWVRFSNEYADIYHSRNEWAESRC